MTLQQCLFVLVVMPIITMSALPPEKAVHQQEYGYGLKKEDLNKTISKFTDYKIPLLRKTGLFFKDVNHFWMTVIPAYTPLVNLTIIITFVVGIPGHVISFLVWLKLHRKNSSFVYLTCYSFIEVILLSLIHKEHFTKKKTTTDHVYEAFILFFCHVGTMVVFSFTAERFASIMFPYAREKICTTKNALLCTLCMCIFVAPFAIPTAFGYGSKIALNASTEAVFSFVVPCSALIMNIFLVRRLTQLSKEKFVSYNANGLTKQSNNLRVRSSIVTLLTLSNFMIIVNLSLGIIFTLMHHFAVNLGVSLFVCACHLSCHLQDLKVARIFDPDSQLYMRTFTAKTIINFISITYHSSGFIMYYLTSDCFKNTVNGAIMACFMKPSKTQYKHLIGFSKGIDTQVTTNGLEDCGKRKFRRPSPRKPNDQSPALSLYHGQSERPTDPQQSDLVSTGQMSLIPSHNAHLK